MYRDPVVALEARLAQLREERARLDAEIESGQIVLDAWRPRARRSPWSWRLLPAAARAGLGGILSLGFVALDPLCLWSCCGNLEDTTRTRAATIRSAATLYAAQTPDAECPTVGGLVDEGYLEDGADFTDGWGNPYWIECHGGEVVVRSCGFDGENILAACEARTP